MAWEQPTLEGITQCVINSDTAWETAEVRSGTWPNYPHASDIVFNGYIYINDSTQRNTPFYILGDANSELNFYVIFGAYGNQITYCAGGSSVGNPVAIATVGDQSNDWGNYSGFAIGRNLATDTYNIIIIAQRRYRTDYYAYSSQPNGQHGLIKSLVELAFNSQTVQYNWQSVPSISGKNGILNLSQIASASINDGEAVSGASASAFDSLTAQVSTLVTDDSVRSGADAGGISGSGSNSGNQSSGYAFGQGESGTNLSGGGSGLYGGNKGGSLLSGGAGSGYIGNSLVSNKKMVGYNIPTSSAESTKTESVNESSATPVSGKPKIGNGFARIKYVANYKVFTFEELIKTDDLTHYKETWVGSTSIDDNWSTLSQWLDTDWNLSSQNGYGTYQLVKDNDEYALGSTSISSMSLYALPLKNKIKVRAIIFDGKFDALTNSVQSQMHLRMGCTNNGVHSIVGALTVSQGDGYDYKVTDTSYHTFIKQFNSVETNYLEFYNGQYKDYFKNIKVIVEE